MIVFDAVKRVVNAQLARHGRQIAHKDVVPSFERFAAALQRSGLWPRTVIDVGVAYGTPWLYAAFPDAKFHLIDPTRESLLHMRRWAEQLDAVIHNFALGDSEDELMIDVREEIGGSSLFKEIGPSCSISKYPVPVRRFDMVFESFARPALCKIDVQGAELLVLCGMGDRFHDLDAIIVETSLIATIHNAPEIADVVSVMREHGFTLYDIVGVTRRPLDRAMAQVDAVFVPIESPLRGDRRWTDRI